MDLSDRTFITLDCPNCGFGTDIQFFSVRLQETVFCPCCKAIIQLVDVDASAHAADKIINSAVDDLQQELKNLEKTVRVHL